jgi:hypothetical protein
MDTTSSQALKLLRKQLVDMREAYSFMRDGFDQGFFDNAVETVAEKNRARSIYALCFDDVEDAIELLDKAE